MQIDNHRALEVGHVSEGFRSFEVRRPKGQQGYPEVTVRESPDQLTLTAEEVGTWKSYTNVHHIAKERWGPPLVDADWHAFCQALYKDIEGEDWGELHDAYKDTSRAVTRGPESKSPLENEGSQGCRRRILRSNA